jgi:hypothetical protein
MFQKIEEHCKIAVENNTNALNYVQNDDLIALAIKKRKSEIRNINKSNLNFELDFE